MFVFAPGRSWFPPLCSLVAKHFSQLQAGCTQGRASACQERYSQDMAMWLQAAGVPVTLVMIQHEGHGLAVPTAGQVEQPGPTTLIQMIVNFFARTL